MENPYSPVYLSLLDQPRLEEGPLSLPPRMGELELQARFFAGEFGDRWTTRCGRQVYLKHPGEWNPEAGPDFRRAVVIFDGVEERCGDLELDLEAAGWERHRHAINPAFEQVLVHFYLREGRKTCFARTMSNRLVPQVKLSPEAAGNRLPRMEAKPLATLEQAQRIVAEAAKHRLALKARQARRLRRLHGEEAALWQLLGRYLGAPKNSLAMALLTQRVGHMVAASAGGEALLFGVAGFLEGEQIGTGASAPELTAYLRHLWEGWWKLRHEWERLILPGTLWVYSGIRPASHPHRRVGALAALATGISGLVKLLSSGDAEGFGRFIGALEHTFWGSHWNLSGGALGGGRASALAGKATGDVLVVNVWCAWRAATGREGYETALKEWTDARSPVVPRRLAAVARWLFPEWPGEELQRVAVQQGLIQLAADFYPWANPAELAERLGMGSG